MAKPPSPNAWTLRFKRGKSTVLLLIDSLAPFTRIKSDLLTAIREIYPDGMPPINSSLTLDPKSNLASSKAKLIPIPEKAEEITLGVPIDTFEPEKGWTELSMGYEDEKGGKVEECPKSLGLKDGGLIAFRFIGEEWGVLWSSYAEEYPEDEGGEEEMID